MKKLLFVAILLIVATSFVMSQTLPTMANGKHDFRYSKTSGIKGASEKLCNYCHTPHVPATGIKAPLWSRAKLASTGFEVYSNDATLDANPTALETGDVNNSSMCMSCHDGSLLFTDIAYVKKPDAGSVSWTTTGADTLRVGSSANLHGGTKYGTGLSHTHPVNFTYADGGAGIHPTPISINASAVPPLYDGKMQCGSCHDPHLSSKMTRATTDNGTLCISCHQK